MKAKTDQIILGSATNSYYVQIRTIEDNQHFYKYAKADIADKEEARDLAVKLSKEKNVPMVNRILSEM